jgi:hypothetical protein
MEGSRDDTHRNSRTIEHYVAERGKTSTSFSTNVSCNDIVSILVSRTGKHLHLQGNVA